MDRCRDTHSDGLDESPGDEIDVKELKKRLLYHQHKQKLELRKRIYEIRRILDQNIISLSG